MDIFTTALTRVVPVPIKPADLKVKALAKAAAINAVTDDIAGLEDQPLYFKKTSAKNSSDKEQAGRNADEQTAEDLAEHATEVVEASPELEEHTGQHIDVFDDSESIVLEKDDKPHLDIFV